MDDATPAVLLAVAGVVRVAGVVLGAAADGAVRLDAVVDDEAEAAGGAAAAATPRCGGRINLDDGPFGLSVTGADSPELAAADEVSAAALFLLAAVGARIDLLVATPVDEAAEPPVAAAPPAAILLRSCNETDAGLVAAGLLLLTVSLVGLTLLEVDSWFRSESPDEVAAEVAETSRS